MPNTLIPINVAKKEIATVINRVNGLIEKDLTAFQAKAESVKYSLFKKVERVKID